MLITDEMDVVIIGGVGDLESFDGQARDAVAQLVEDPSTGFRSGRSRSICHQGSWCLPRRDW